MVNAGRPKSKEATKVFHLRFEKSTLEHLDEIAALQGGRSLSSLVRQIVDDYLKTQLRDPDGFWELLPPGNPIRDWNDAVLRRRQDAREKVLAEVMDQERRSRAPADS